MGHPRHDKIQRYDIFFIFDCVPIFDVRLVFYVSGLFFGGNDIVSVFFDFLDDGDVLVAAGHLVGAEKGAFIAPYTQREVGCCQYHDGAGDIFFTDTVYGLDCIGDDVIYAQCSGKFYGADAGALDMADAIGNGGDTRHRGGSRVSRLYTIAISESAVLASSHD